MSDFDRQLGDWLEDGPQTIPDWVLDEALARAHVAPQMGAGLRLPWTGRTVPSPALGRLAPLLAGAIGALAVVAAFALGLLSAPRIGDGPPTPTHVVTPSATPTLTTPAPSLTGALPRPVRGAEVVGVLPGESGDVYALIGLAATQDAVWTVAVSADPVSGDPISRLIRIDATTGAAEPVGVPGVVGILSPPVADGEIVWTASAGGLHSIDATGATQPVTVPLGFEPAEIATSPEGLWIARSGGTSLVDPRTGEVLREIPAHAGSRLGRIHGAPVFGSLWECVAGSLLRVDAVSGAEVSTIALPLEERDRCRHAVGIAGVDGLGEGVIPMFANVLVDPQTNAVASEFDLGGDYSDVLSIDGRLWFEVSIRGLDQDALVELDPVSGQPAQILTFSGAGYANTAFQSGTLAVTSDYVWVLVDPTPDASDGPQIVRIPRAELGIP